MPEIKAFRGIRYNGEVLKDLSRVVAPPYDVISKKEQAALYRKSPHNVVRLILGKGKDKYTHAARFLKKWQSSGVLIQDPWPVIYVYVQNYREEGRQKTRLGFLAAMRLDEKAVLRHENTLAAPKKDRMALLKEVKTNLSPIFGLFEDPKGTIQNLLKKTLSLSPCVDVEIAGVRHRVFLETRVQIIHKLLGLMKSKPMFIADGHHRFEVACQFKRDVQAKHPHEKNAPYHYIMTYFSDCRHNPFKIFPTHRLLRPVNGPRAWQALEKRGTLRKVSGLPAILSELARPRREAGSSQYSFGVYSRKKGFFIYTLNDNTLSKIKKNPVTRLDVAVLHDHLIKPCFGIKAVERSTAIDFTRDAREACRRVQNGDFELAVFLRPTSLSEMILVSKKGLKMPQKSTYFYPKLLSGLVFHSLEATRD